MENMSITDGDVQTIYPLQECSTSIFFLFSLTVVKFMLKTKKEFKTSDSIRGVVTDSVSS